MDIPRVKIQQRPSKIGLNIQKPNYELEQQKSQLEISQEAGKLNIEKDFVEINVDSYPHEYDLGYKNPRDRTKEIANTGKQSAMQAINKYIKQGDQLMEISSGKNMIIEQAKEVHKQKKAEVGLKWKRGPDIEVKPHKLKMNYKPVPPKFDSKMGSVEGKLDWGRVKVSIDQLYKTKISIVGGKLNRLM